MPTAVNPLSEISRVAVDTAARLARISMDSTERVMALQLDYAKSALDQATRTAKAVAGAKDVQEFLSMRTRTAESAVDKLIGYSRNLYEVASEAQSELSKLAEERMTTFQQVVTESVEQAAKAAPAGSDFAVAAMKSSLAATTAAFDSFTKTAKHVASFTDAGVKAAGNAKRK
ncbi:MAG TPA: phasin family protein [Usitatibacter sp.]|nr:phasin family protein [Usitatibacter sp.]